MALELNLQQHKQLLNKKKRNPTLLLKTQACSSFPLLRDIKLTRKSPILTSKNVSRISKQTSKLSFFIYRHPSQSHMQYNKKVRNIDVIISSYEYHAIIAKCSPLNILRKKSKKQRTIILHRRLGHFLKNHHNNLRKFLTAIFVRANATVTIPTCVNKITKFLNASRFESVKVQQLWFY